MTRRQFGLGLLGTIASFLLGGWWLRRRGEEPRVPASSNRARFWRRADHLAG